MSEFMKILSDKLGKLDKDALWEWDKMQDENSKIVEQVENKISKKSLDSLYDLYDPNKDPMEDQQEDQLGSLKGKMGMQGNMVEEKKFADSILQESVKPPTKTAPWIWNSYPYLGYFSALKEEDLYEAIKIKTQQAQWAYDLFKSMQDELNAMKDALYKMQVNKYQQTPKGSVGASNAPTENSTTSSISTATPLQVPKKKGI